ncbi:MAG TPA: cytochrome c [Azospirillaceae bacterium]|nr:cytochrome c [Azospirillaceae bacterium]
MGQALILIALLVVAGHAVAEPIAPTRQQALLHLLKQDCGSCHGLTLKGGLGPPLLPRTLAGKDADALAAVILDGAPGTPMPPWRPFLSPEEARWLVDRLREGVP